MKKHLFFFLFLILLSSCKKETNFHITAKNAVTGVPFAGLTYYIVEYHTGASGGDYKTISTGTLDANGEINLNSLKNGVYLLRVLLEDNTVLTQQIQKL